MRAGLDVVLLAQRDMKREDARANAWPRASKRRVPGEQNESRCRRPTRRDGGSAGPCCASRGKRREARPRSASSKCRRAPRRAVSTLSLHLVRRARTGRPEEQLAAVGERQVAAVRAVVPSFAW